MSISSADSNLDNRLRRRNSVHLRHVRRQGIYWIATIPRPDYEWPNTPPEGIVWQFGQLERGEHSGYEHWQFVFAASEKLSLRGVTAIYPSTGHYELSRSAAADAYVCKLDTRIDGPFECGVRPFKRNSTTDWQRVWELARTGNYCSVITSITID